MGDRDRVAETRKDPPFLMRITTPMEQYRWDTFWDKEPETIAWIDSFAPDTVFWDIGANIGVYSLYAASLDRGIKVIAFEPHDANNKQLHINRDENRFTMKPKDFQEMVICACAVGDRVGMGSMDVPDVCAGATGAQMRESMHIGDVPFETVDHLAEVYGPPDYVKIDIDGQEAAVVRGMAKTLWTIKSILVEVSEASRLEVGMRLLLGGFTVRNQFNEMTPHSRERRQREGIDAENIIFTRR